MKTQCIGVIKCIVLVFCLLCSLCGCAEIASIGQTERAQSDAISVEGRDDTLDEQTEEVSASFTKTDSADSSAKAQQNVTDHSSPEHSADGGLRIVPDQNGSVLVFASDYQHRDGWEDPPVTLNRILDVVYGEGIQPDNFIFCGDYTALDGHNNYNANPHDAIEEIKGICIAHDALLDTEQMIFEQGNHDEKTEDISDSGLHEYEDYLVYVINTEEDFPWGQGKRQREETVIRGAMRLRDCLDELIERGETRPVFLASHVPLHFSGRTSYLQGSGDNLYSRHLFEVINAAGEDLNLIYLYGHNHSRGWDSYLGGSCVFREPGDWLLIPKVEENEKVTSQYTQETLTFTYLNAGYVGYFVSEGKEDQLESTLTCAVCEIKGDRLTFTRYSVDGAYLLNGEGKRNPAKDDTRLIPQEYYGALRYCPHSIELIHESRETNKAA